MAEKRAGGATVLDLTESNPTLAGLAYPERLMDSLANPAALRYEPDPAGMAAARAAVASYYGGSVAPNRVLLTASTSEAYSFVFKLLADPGDEVLVPRPSYPLFEFLAELESVKAVQYPLVYDHGWMIDFERLASLTTPRTRAIVVVNPNNPTGSFLKREELVRLSALCRERGLALIADEVFADYAFGEDESRVSTLAGRELDMLSFSLSGLSKVSGLPQVKLGWIVVSGPEPWRSDAYARLEFIADTYLSVGTPVQCAAPVLLDAGISIREQIRRRTAENLRELRRLVGGSAFGLLEVEGGWYATVQVPRIRSEEEWVLELLERLNVLVQPGFFYDFEHEGFVVVSLLTPEAIFKEGIEHLLALE